MFHSLHNALSLAKIAMQNFNTFKWRSFCFIAFKKNMKIPQSTIQFIQQNRWLQKQEKDRKTAKIGQTKRNDRQGVQKTAIFNFNGPFSAVIK